MSCSLWQCDEPGCTKTAVGKGGAVGLRAIGWYFKAGQGDDLGPILYCPIHRPDGIDCIQKPGTLCSQCAAERDVRIDQPKLMNNDELNHYVSEILPILQRNDLEVAVRLAEGRSLFGMAHYPDMPILCEHGVREYGACKNAGCPNCVDNILPDPGPLAPPEYRPHVASTPGPPRCATCELCTPGQPCKNSDNCPILWCACHRNEPVSADRHSRATCYDCGGCLYENCKTCTPCTCEEIPEQAAADA